ncbi:glycosyltransferase N-terminal domain-containing protein [Sphingobacterium oryzagri]|uniref:3-deoxy-D-manno-octulosonic acid transferase n=1 Tax=Sphingobacterium oryzagri TaxID=3025669 RepID=A0ABY7WHN7_9SPHI|nr:glycosyltransferase N-terminal domain-containing protein [Sphingobacterium sp. KACC 22765]WDF69139.1 glycosyltransferase N-terminal domain-containing protein [Sphingobacterium sp. KACC 22765]
MRVFYDLGIGFYALILRLIAPFHSKAKRWVDGRKGLLKYIEQTIEFKQKPIWFHFASLGEFEQGRSIMEAIKSQYPNEKIVVTFFSPSGYEIRKNTPLADHVFYLPLDTAKNARMFLALINPKFAVFTKYEYWYHYFKALRAQNIPLFMVSAIFREDQVFFKWYGGFFRKILKQVSFFFAQNIDSVHWLKSIHIKQAGLAGDTRFDRVVSLPKQRQVIAAVETFIQSADQVIVAGSTWPEDEQLLAAWLQQANATKILLAPHEIGQQHLDQLAQLFPTGLFFSQFASYSSDAIAVSPVLIIDNIGMLSSLYGYGDLCYIGGGFGAGIHNTLEAATYGKPVIFGPKYYKFQEAKDLLEIGAGFSIDGKDQLFATLNALSVPEKQSLAGEAARKYVVEKAGATPIIMKYLVSQKFLQK